MSRLFPSEHLMPRQNCAHKHKRALQGFFSHVCPTTKIKKPSTRSLINDSHPNNLSSARLVFTSSCANSIHQPFLINIVATYEGWEFSVRRKRRTREWRRTLFGEFPFQWHQHWMLTSRWRSKSGFKGRHKSSYRHDTICSTSKLIKGLIGSAVEAQSSLEWSFQQLSYVCVSERAQSASLLSLLGAHGKLFRVKSTMAGSGRR